VSAQGESSPDVATTTTPDVGWFVPYFRGFLARGGSRERRRRTGSASAGSARSTTVPWRRSPPPWQIR